MKRRHILSFSVVTVLGLVPAAAWARPDVISDYVLLAASAGPPGVDIHKTCRESERAITAIFGNSTAATFENCMRQEQTDQAQIVKDRASYPAARERPPGANHVCATRTCSRARREETTASSATNLPGHFHENPVRPSF
jgi:hypothetical protein